MGCLILGTILGAAAQTASWRQLGSSAADLQGLAGPATGPMAQVWFAADGQLYARTIGGNVYRTQDFENWKAVADPPAPPRTFSRQPARVPQNSDTVFVSLSESSPEMWGLGRQLFRSTDGGRAWDVLTAHQSDSLVGSGIRSVAVAPSNPEQIIVASDAGVWRSMDGGLTWSGLNVYLPNLTVSRILSIPNGSRGTRILTDKLGVLELPHGSALWQRPTQANSSYSAEIAQRLAYSGKTNTTVTTFASFGNTVYAGTRDGQVMRSVDGGATFPQRFLPGKSGQTVERIFVDAAAPQLVLVALSGDGPRVMRSVSAGNVWDDLSSNLPAGQARGLAADLGTGSVYVATDAGVFYAHADLQASSQAEPWRDISPVGGARAVDVQLDPTGLQLYSALEGYGVFTAPAPHRERMVKLVNAADYTDRPAAPGSLVSVVGQQVTEVRNGGATFPVWNLQGTESQIQVPFSASNATVALELTTTNGKVNRDLKVQPVSPAIFVSRDGTPALFDADTMMALEMGNQAHAGQRIQVLMTGLGRVTPEWQSGVPALAQNTPRVVAPVAAFVNRGSTAVLNATLAPGYIGTYLVEVQLPAVANYGAMDLYITADGVESNHVQVVIVP